MHLFGNMLCLLFFAPMVEGELGKKRFWQFYMLALVLGSCSWVIEGLITDADTPCLGASGAVTAVIILFALCFPEERLTLFQNFLFFGLLGLTFEIPVWVFAILIVGGDIARMFLCNDNVAHGVHLTGAAFAVIYYCLVVHSSRK